MSYDKKIGFIPGTSSDPAAFLRKMKVENISHDLKSLLPDQSKEPEPKIWLPNPHSFFEIRNLINRSSNGFIIPGQMWIEKFPLVSVLADSRKNGYPTAKLDTGNRSLRLRFEVDPLTGQHMQYDYNEKSGLAVSNMIGGLQDRDEREFAFDVSTSFEDGYKQFVESYRDKNDPAFCDKIPYSELHVYGGYIAARTEYGFAIRHPEHPVLFVFEACEDVYDTYLSDMCVASQTDVCEFEFEPKQIWGRLPNSISDKEDFREFLYASMIQIRDHIARNIPGAMVNLKSKAENTKEHLANYVLFGNIAEIGLTEFYTGRVPAGYSAHLTALQHSLSLGHSIQSTLQEAQSYLAYRCSEMHNEKLQRNKGYMHPEAYKIGRGNSVIPINGHARNKEEGYVVSGP